MLARLLIHNSGLEWIKIIAKYIVVLEHVGRKLNEVRKQPHAEEHSIIGAFQLKK